MRSPMELAAACEDGTVPDRALELEIWRVNGGSSPPGKTPQAWLHCYTSTVDAALELCAPDDMHDVVREASSRIGRRFRLHVGQWPADVSYARVLARFVAAAALRRIDVRRRSETGRDAELEWIELDDVHVSLASTYYRLGDKMIEEGSDDLDPRPIARAWNVIAKMLVEQGIIRNHPGDPTDEMVAAGQAAYDRKNDDMWSQSPTEEPEAGGGPIGYAWRAMARTRTSGAIA